MTTSDIEAQSSELDNFVKEKEKIGFKVSVIKETAWNSGQGMLQLRI